ncbi:MAG: hypothetical protein R2856_08495 [Caldilineaceae bacterium]
MDLMIDVITDIKQLALPADPLVGQALMVLTDIISIPTPAIRCSPAGAVSPTIGGCFPAKTCKASSPP